MLFRSHIPVERAPLILSLRTNTLLGKKVPKNLLYDHLHFKNRIMTKSRKYIKVFYIKAFSIAYIITCKKTLEKNDMFDVREFLLW